MKRFTPGLYAKSDPIADTIGNADVCKLLEDSLMLTVKQVHRSEDPHPTYLQGCAGQLMYYYAIHNASHELSRYGFEVINYNSQIRLGAIARYEYPVYISFFGGVLVNGIVTFKWPRGAVTIRSMWENGGTYTPLQLGLFDPIQPNMSQARSLNLGVVYDVSSRHLRAWLVMGTEWLDKKTLVCPEWTPICSNILELASIADIVPVDDDSNYDIPFSEKTES